MLKSKKLFIFALFAACCGLLAAAPATEEEMHAQFESLKNKKVILLHAWTDSTPDVVFQNIDVLLIQEIAFIHGGSPLYL